MAEKEIKQDTKETPQAAAKSQPSQSAPQTAVEHLQAAADILEAKDTRSRAVKTFHGVASDLRALIARLESRGGA